MSIAINDIAPDVCQVESPNPGPTVTVLGGVHGSEQAGVKIIKNIMEFGLLQINRAVQRGKLNLGIGNPLAVEQNVRFLPGDYDLNRCFGTLPPGIEKTIAATRAEVLKPIIAASDVLLDLHGTIKPSEPMILTPSDIHDPLVSKLIAVLGIAKVIQLHEDDDTGVTTDSYAHKHGKIGITLETGWQEDTSVVPRMQKAIFDALAVIGISDPLETAPEPMQIEEYDAYWSVLATPSFAFTQDWANFETLPAGTHFATSEGEKLVTPCDSQMIFQKSPDRITPGLEACLLLRKGKL